MIDIDFKQFRMLKRIKHKKLIKSTNFTKEQLDICAYLKSNDFITVRTVLSESPHYNEYRITQKGSAQLSAYVASFHKWWIPLIISIGSFILSCISLLKQ